MTVSCSELTHCLMMSLASVKVMKVASLFEMATMTSPWLSSFDAILPGVTCTMIQGQGHNIVCKLRSSVYDVTAKHYAWLTGLIIVSNINSPSERWVTPDNRDHQPDESPTEFQHWAAGDARFRVSCCCVGNTVIIIIIMTILLMNSDKHFNRFHIKMSSAQLQKPQLRVVISFVVRKSRRVFNLLNTKIYSCRVVQT